ncbi:flagellar hook-associated protein 3 FlgL [Clostridium tetanomorphum]|uniref:Flagellar hook-associated protein FlgL n=1 Tax=Clostridium tetanomorphum TaxID=1553 RepID=A0A923J0L5_CLOTT|nr:flagellar hook-associated protein FlgL [Clostridium tetanomorphum]KAJ53499.1 Flagellin [Clostridium tetanomorphum DSM 665]MBC2398426.1 flagellar hook-associated protein FlgL [Clostridium tetanomorphum]MBP1865268.1 flagellar hook-associated protein 3 FlgL [Clostridium tetanomorphum]NRS85191.1 flagellar hook-associated protein 3 FlgL [Clostridium tetanomorphum]NRZ98370.1 flagellar hook-associated protein 3 FlgL [Clostridium tetanomorphum]
MRITNTMMADNFLNDMMSNLEKLNTLDMQLTSGKEIRRPSDDPFKVARAMQLHTDINTNKQYNENIKDTLNWLNQTDTALNQMGNQFQRVRELLISSGNAAYGSSERKKIKDEINEIIGQFSQTLNSAFDGKYLFSGTRGTTKPTTTIKGPKVTEIQPQIVQQGSNKGKLSGKATVGGKYSGTENIDFEVKVNGTNVTFTANGKNISPVKNGDTWDLGNGLTFKIDEALIDGSGYKFTAVAEGNTKIIFNGKEDYEVSDASPLSCKISELKAWDGKNTTFNVNGQEINLEFKNIKTTEDIINTINSNEKLKGKVIAREVKNGGETSIEIFSLDNNKAFIKEAEGEEVIKDLKGKTNKFMGTYEFETMGEGLITEISQGVTIEYNVTASQLIKFTDEKGNERNLKEILENVVRHLDSPDGSSGVKEISEKDLLAIDTAMNNILKLRSQVGAKQNRMESAEEKNTEENFNMTEILSKTEDIDFTKKTMELAVAQTVYMAALQTSARIIQPTLMDYLR